jgi:hypothetical protein
MESFLGDDCWEESHGHWAVGHVDGFVIRVFKDESHKEVTSAWQKFCELQGSIEDYPVLDEEDYSEKEYEAAVENISEIGRSFVIDSAPDDWPEQVWSWLWNNDQIQLDNGDGNGAYPSEDSVKKALADLNIHEDQYS